MAALRNRCRDDGIAVSCSCLHYVMPACIMFPPCGHLAPLRVRVRWYPCPMEEARYAQSQDLHIRPGGPQVP
jgi:hypothetical protein